jgi:hypothetical protein
MQDRRKAKRYRLSVPAYFSWQHHGGRLLQLGGITRDISMKGVFFLTGASINVGTRLELEIVLPTPNGHGRGITLRGEGKVLRVEPIGTVETGIAAEVAFEGEGEPEETLLSLAV